MKDESRLTLLKQVVESAENSIISAKQIIAEMNGEKVKIPKRLKEKAKNLSVDEENRIVEGIFDGELMICPDGKKYPVQSNYASKSKLVPGDTLKLTILEDGTFIFKQINLIDRKRIIGTLVEDGENYKVIANGKAYNVITASVTYFKGKLNDEVTLIIPEKEDSDWGVIENIIINPLNNKKDE